MSRRWIDPESAADIGKLDQQAIGRGRGEAWPDAATPDELHDALLWLTFLTDEERQRNAAWPRLMDELAASGRVARLSAAGLSAAEGDARRAIVWGATERRGLFEPLPISDGSFVEIVRGRLEGLGALTASAISDSPALPGSWIIICLCQLQGG